MTPIYANNWKTGAGKGLIRGAYHFYHADDDPVQQADKFLCTIGILASSDLPPIIDVEAGGLGNSGGVDIQASVLSWLTTVKAKTNRIPIVYTNPSTARTYLTDGAFADYPLWVSELGVASPNLNGTPWEKTSWVFWQSSWAQSIIIGKNDTVKNDYDSFNGI